MSALAQVPTCGNCNIPDETPGPRPTPRGRPLTIDELENLHTGAPYAEEARREHQKSPNESSVSMMLATKSSVRLTTDTTPDAENDTITVNYGGVPYTNVAHHSEFFNYTFNKYLTGIAVQRSSNLSSFSAPLKVTIPSPYLRTFDPTLAANTAADGIAPGRVYLAGIAAMDNPPDPTSVRVWQSSDGGGSWSNGGSEVGTSRM